MHNQLFLLEEDAFCNILDFQTELLRITPMILYYWFKSAYPPPSPSSPDFLALPLQHLSPTLWRLLKGLRGSVFFFVFFLQT